MIILWERLTSREFGALQSRPVSRSYFSAKWRGISDSNRWRPARQAGTLAAELMPPWCSVWESNPHRSITNRLPLPFGYGMVVNMGFEPMATEYQSVLYRLS